jgi:hypothetical protein
MKSVNHYGLYKDLDFDLTQSLVATNGDNECFEKNLDEESP